MVPYFTLVTPESLREAELKSLGFAMRRAYIGAQLLSYQEAKGAHHKNRAYSFFKTINHTQEETQLKELIDQQVQLLQGKNPYPLLQHNEEYKTNIENVFRDKYYEIIGHWSKAFTGK